MRLGIDLTRRDLQSEAKKKGRPWDMAKGFDQSAPISKIHQVNEIGHPEDAKIWLSVNAQIRQIGNINEQIWGVPECISKLSSYISLKAGDLIFTGTPAGVGAIHSGDRVCGGIEGIDEIQITIK